MAKKALKGVKPVREGRSNPKRIVIKKARTSAKRVVQRKPTPAVSSLLTASSLVEDHLAIQQLLHKYCHVVDRGTADEVAALFHRTAVLLRRYQPRTPHGLRPLVAFVAREQYCRTVEQSGDFVCRATINYMTIFMQELLNREMIFNQ